MRSKLFFALALPLPFALFVACGSGTPSGNSSGDDDGSDASNGADIGSPVEHDGSTTGDSGGSTTGDGAVATGGDSGAKADAGAKKDAATGPLKTDGGDCIGNGGDPMTGYEFQCGLIVSFTPAPCTSGHNDCAADHCCYTDPASSCVQGSGPQCVMLTGF